MAPPSLPIAYVAHTERTKFFLDCDGICRLVVAVQAGRPMPQPASGDKKAIDRCVGAQYVASIDTKINGKLVDLPRVGSPLVFAVIEDGRIALIQTGSLLRFEVKRRQRSSTLSSSAPLQAPGPEPASPGPYADGNDLATIRFRSTLMEAASGPPTGAPSPPRRVIPPSPDSSATRIRTSVRAQERPAVERIPVPRLESFPPNGSWRRRMG